MKNGIEFCQSSMVKNYRALIVDDKLPVQRLTASALRQAGFDCQCVSDGEIASKLAKEESFHVVVTELKIPNKHGHALTLELLELHSRPVIVIHTGFKEPRLVKDLLLRGVDDIIFKPIDFDLLAAKVYALVQRRYEHSVKDPGVNREQPPVGQLQRVTLEQLNARLAEVTQLLPLSRGALEVYQLSASLDQDVSDIAMAISRDASITTDVLRFANSSMYNVSGKRIVNLEEAVLRIGQKKVGEIALAAHALSVLTPNALPWMNLDLTWRRSIAAGVLVEELVDVGGHTEIEGGLSLSAIMHPLGRTLLGLLFPAHYDTMLKECEQNGESLEEQESRVFPVSHTEIAGVLLASWTIPPEVFVPLKFSLRDFSSLARLAEPLRTKTELVKVAILLSRLAVGYWEDWDLVQLPPGSVLRRLGIRKVSDLLRRTRQNLELTHLGRHVNTPNSPHIRTVSSPEIRYCDVSGTEPDLLFELLPAVGLKPQACKVGDLQALDRNVIANCIGRVPRSCPLRS